MASTFHFLLLQIAIVSASSSLYAIGDQQNSGSRFTEESLARRALLSFKETPGGSNVTFECSPAGPCVPCVYSEKNDDKYRCSETGYRISFKCVAHEVGLKNANGKKTQNGRSTLETSPDIAKLNVELRNAEQLTGPMKLRSLLDNSSSLRSQTYITYRSCIPAVDEEKLSVIGFEGIVLGLLFISSSFVYYRRKRTATMPGVAAGRMQTNSRF